MTFPRTPQTWTDGIPNQGSAGRFNDIEAGIQLAGVYGVSASPPGSPVDGMIWRLPAASGSGVYWFFQYDSSQATYKWVFMGGAPLSHEILTDESTTSITYVDLATVGPTLTLPRAGDYKVEFGAQLNNASAGTGTVAAIKRGAAATSDNDAIVHTLPTTANLVTTNARAIVLTGMAASDVVKMQYKSGGATAAHALRRWMMITPIRVI